MPYSVALGHRGGNQYLKVLQYKWSMIVLLTGIATINYADRTAISSVFPLLRSDLHSSDVALAAIGSFFLWDGKRDQLSNLGLSGRPCISQSNDRLESLDLEPCYLSYRIRPEHGPTSGNTDIAGAGRVRISPRITRVDCRLSPEGVARNRDRFPSCRPQPRPCRWRGRRRLRGSARWLASQFPGVGRCWSDICGPGPTILCDAPVTAPTVSENNIPALACLALDGETCWQ